MKSESTRCCAQSLQPPSNAESYYFLFVTIMLYIKDKEEFSKMREEVVDGAVSFIRNHPDGFVSTEFFMLFFDFLSCPYINLAIKERAYETALDEEITSGARDKFNLYVRNGLFVDWENPDFLRSNLEKKKFTFAYG